MADLDRDLGSDDEVAPSSPPTASPRHPSEQVLPDRSGDDADIGWSQSPDPDGSDEWYQRERPPHHEG